MGLLDQIIESQSVGARVVSENHNTATINWVRGMSDPGEMIGCGMYQELRRHAHEEDEVYQARITVILQQLPADVRAKIMKAGMEAALKRASLNVSNGRVSMMAAGKLPWHGLGVLVDQATTSIEAIRLAGLDWLVEKIQPMYTYNGITHKSSGYDIIRTDTGASLGTVGGRYEPIQNRDGFAFLDGVLKEFGAKYETAGALYNGEKVWMLAQLPNQAFTINGGDEQLAYCLFQNCHDGTGAANCFPTSVRVVCANTQRMANKDKGKGLTIRHTGDVKAKIRAAQNAMGIAVKEFDDYKEAADVLYHKPLNISHYANDVLDAVLDITQAEMMKGADVLAASIAATEAARELASKSIAKKIERRSEILEDILNRYESRTNGLNGIRGTAWAAFNAVTEHADHAKVGRQAQDLVTRDSRRFESVISGDRDDMKQTALQFALKA